MNTQPHHLLAKAVLVQALRDALSKHDSIKRREARSFLSSSSPGWASSLKFWCHIAEISYPKLSLQIKELKRNNWKRLKNYNLAIYNTLK